MFPFRWTIKTDTDSIVSPPAWVIYGSGVPAYAKTPGPTGMFIADDLPFFSTRQGNFFITNVSPGEGEGLAIDCEGSYQTILRVGWPQFWLAGRKKHIIGRELWDRTLWNYDASCFASLLGCSSRRQMFSPDEEKELQATA